MTQYLLSVHSVEGEADPSPEVMQEMFTAVDAFNTRLQAEGAWVYANGLQPADIATVVRVVDGEAVTTDGPFAESKEHLGGFWIIEAADLDAALAWAEAGARACQGPVEIRPMQGAPAE